MKSLTKQVWGAVNTIAEPLARSGWLGPLPIGGVGLVLLESTGRRSGHPRRRPLLAARIGDQLVVGTVRPRSDWIANARAASTSTVWSRGGPEQVTVQMTDLPRGSLATLRRVPSER